jgi:hypothetical protein
MLQSPAPTVDLYEHAKARAREEQPSGRSVLEADIRTTWIARLRSGEYAPHQAQVSCTSLRRWYRDKDFIGWHAMGILCDILNNRAWEGPTEVYGSYSWLDSYTHINPNATAAIGLDIEDVYTLERMGDWMLPFTDIADWIEKHL